MWIPDSFFSSLLSGRISTLRDETGAIFIDRDPAAFAPILNFLRTKELDLRRLEFLKNYCVLSYLVISQYYCTVNTNGFEIE
eukprot:XP_022271151.1 BTB/POZ domain-containing protein KCTD3-like isoform X2 [Canis lupus familiaris]